MDKTNRVALVLIVAAFMAAMSSLLVSACSTEPDGKALVESRCITCHSLRIVEEADKSFSEWEILVSRMVSLGARLNAKQQAAVVRYLASDDQ